MIITSIINTIQSQSGPFGVSDPLSYKVLSDNLLVKGLSVVSELTHPANKTSFIAL